MKKKLLLLLLVFCPILGWSKFIPYQGKMYSLKSKHFYIVYPKKFQNKAETVVDYAESIFENLQPLMQWKPRRRITIVITDHTDSPNGIATTFPENIIYLYMAPSGLSDELRDFSNPLYSLVLHELTHILQLDQISQGAWFWRIFFSRAYFPLSGAFTWFHEGTAVYAESRYGAGGRLDSAKHKAIIDSFARSRTLPDYGKIVYPIVDYPYNCLAYHLGARFLDYLSTVYGEEKFTAFQYDLSNDFWPFVYEFVLKFKKHYGKSLKKLWNDWRNYEYSRIEKTEWFDDVGISQLPTNGNVNSMAIANNALIYSCTSIKDGKGIFSWDADTGKKEKLSGDAAKNMCLYGDNILCIRNIISPAGFDSDDIFMFSLKNKTWKRMTYNQRITRMDYNEHANIGVYFRDNGAYLFSIDNGKIRELSAVNALNDFKFAADFHISPSGNKLLFSAQNDINGNYLLCLYDFKNGTTEILPEIRGTAAGWLDDKNIYFIGFTNDGFTKLFSYQLQLQQAKLLFTGNSFVNKAHYLGNDNFYTAVYTSQGAEIRFIKSCNNEVPTDLQWRIEPQKPETQKLAEKNNATFITSLYNPARYLNPNWIVLPFMLDKSFSLYGFNIPYITGGINFYKTLPLGRFSYSLSAALDYINWYPTTTLSLIWNIPCTAIKYSFSTSRNKDIFQFDNQFSASPTFSFDNENTLAFNMNTVISGYFSSLSQSVLITRQYGGAVQYSYLRKHPGAAAWNCGMTATVSAIIATSSNPINGKLDFSAAYFNAETRIPLGKHYFYITNTAGYNLISNQNIFNFGNQFVSLGTLSPLSYNNGTFSQTIEMKSFSLYHEYKANSFVKAEIGALATLYRRTHYWKFLTIGFYGIHLRPFAEYALLRNVDKAQHLIGTGLEFIADFFVAYGNIPLSIVQGNALGYEIGKSHPVYNGYIALNVQL